jgi:hypothetical protein
MTQYNKPHDKPFTRKQLTVIFKIAFLEAMALSIIMPSVTSSGEIPIISSVESGIVSLTYPSQITQVSTNITFPIPFISIPRVTATMISNPSSAQVTTGTFSFLASGTNVNWVNMPNAKTEFLGNINNELMPTFISSTAITFVVDCPTPSNNNGAFLNVEYSFNQAIWISLGVNVTIDNTSNCGFSPVVSITTGIPSGALGSAIFLRVIGKNGGGIGDTPSFTNISLITSILPANPDVPSATSITKTSFILTLNRPFKAVSGPAKSVFWQAEVP